MNTRHSSVAILLAAAITGGLVSAAARAADWEKQAAEDAKQDRTAIAYDGKTPNKLVCDTTLRELPDGSWALFMLAGDDFEPSPKNYTGLTRSTDGGKTWSPLQPVDIGFPREGKTSGQGPTELMVRGNRCTLFFSTHSQTWGRDWKSWMMFSDDCCRTWSKPQPMPGRLANFTFIRNHIVTRDGRILIPFQHYLGPPAGTPPPAAEEKPWHKTLFHYVSNPRNGVLMSSDGGKTWTEHGNIRLTSDDRYHGWAENNIVELSDGRIAMIIRGDRLGGVLYYAESKDGGHTWPEFATKSDIPNPGSKATLYPLGGDAVAILHNPNPKHRSPMALWISFDGMKTWPYRRVLVPESCDGPKGRMNYPDGFVSKDKQWLHFAFDDNRHRAVYYGAKLPPLPQADARSAVEKAHAEMWWRFVDEHNVVLDYTDLDGRIIRPTPQDCREHKPSALSWGVPVEDGPMFNGLYLDAMCNRWKLTRNEADRVKARRLVEGLLFLASLGNTPGFIARGVATDGKTTYPMGSNDQTTPWLYGIWRYVREGLAEPAERGRLVAKFCEQVKALDANDWRMPCDGGPSKYRGGFDKPTWEGAPRLLFVMKAMYEFTGDARWQERYLAAANEKAGKDQRSRLEICRTGMVFDPGQGKRHSWTGSEGVVCLRALWEMETDPALRDAYAQGLRGSAELSAKSLPLCREFNVNGKERFEHDWRVMNEAWKPQHSEAETVEVANAGLRVQSRASPRLHLEKDWVREPCFAAWVVTLCPDAVLVSRYREAILDVITHYRYDRLYLSQFFPVESAWYQLQQK